MRALIFSLSVAVFGLAAPVLAGGQPVVVELFTSQGCSNCPAADAFMRELVKRDDVLPLALHVDYWDYLGWKDRFGSARFSQRQRAYAKADPEGRNTVFTPQMIIEGTNRAVGSRKATVKRLIAERRGDAQRVAIEAVRRGDTLSLRVRPEAGAVGPALIQVVRFIPEKTIAILSGKNAGRTFTYVNIVTEWMPIAVWNGTDSFAVQTQVAGPESVAVLVQAEGPGPIMAVAAVD